MNNEKKARKLNKSALGRVLIAGGVLIIGGVVYYVTAYKIKTDIIKPALDDCKTAADEFLADWFGDSTGKTE